MVGGGVIGGPSHDWMESIVHTLGENYIITAEKSQRSQFCDKRTPVTLDRREVTPCSPDSIRVKFLSCFLITSVNNSHIVSQVAL